MRCFCSLLPPPVFVRSSLVGGLGFRGATNTQCKPNDAQGLLLHDYLRCLHDERSASLWADRSRDVLREHSRIGSNNGGLHRIRPWVASCREGREKQKSDFEGVRWRRKSVVDCPCARRKQASDRVGGMDMQRDIAAYAYLLRVCGGEKGLGKGKRVHAHIVRAGYDGDRFLGNLLVQMYGKCGCPNDARSVFDKIRQRNVFSWNIMVQAYTQNGYVDEARCAFDTMPQRDVVSWTAMIGAYAHSGQGKEALQLFRRMQLESVEPNKITFISILDACAGLAALADGKENHASIIANGFESDVVVGTALVHMYGRCGCLDNARLVFDKISQRSVVSWNAMIAAYSRNGRGKESLELFRQMQQRLVAPDKITFVSILDACTCLVSLVDGKESHASIIDSGFQTDVVVGTALVNMYGKCGSIEGAKTVFNKMSQRNVVSWNAMMTAYSQNAHFKDSLHLFRQMQLKGIEPSKVTFTIILDACGRLTSLADGKEMHARMINSGLASDVAAGSALISMYGKCGSLDDARSAFDKMPHHSVVSWNAMITAYSQNRHGKEALKLFQQLQLESMIPDKVTFISILDACAGLVALPEGKEKHACIIDRKFEADVVVGTALVNMYGKCGDLDDAKNVFDRMPQRNVVSWNAVIAAYSENGCGKEGLEVFRQMQLEGVVPDKLTFISILSGCSHAGLVDDGWYCFISMNRDYSITPILDHFVCMIDLLGRAGQLDAVEDFVNNMPFEPSSAAWMSLLGACRIHGDVNRGAWAAEHIFELDPKISAPFVLLSNIYTAAGKWDDAVKAKEAMKDRNVKKKPGWSCIEVRMRFLAFAAGRREIY